MSINIIKGGAIVSHSKNLGGLLRYAAKHKPVTIHANVLKPTNEGSMYVLFSDGATCRANFASYRVMMDHFIAKRRSWHESGVKITTNE